MLNTFNYESFIDVSHLIFYLKNFKGLLTQSFKVMWQTENPNIQYFLVV